MSNYSRTGIPRSSINFTHPFKIDIGVDGKNEEGISNYTLAVNYHSKLYQNRSIPLPLGDKNYFEFDAVEIEKFTENGLDFPKKVPEEFIDKGENFYCVLEIELDNYQATKAKIVWIKSDSSEEELAPVVFKDTEDFVQTKARIIIGVFVIDDEAIAGTSNQSGTSGQSGAVNTPYILQFINTNLIMCNMVMNGLPIVYPVPFAGGRLNEESFEET